MRVPESRAVPRPAASAARPWLRGILLISALFWILDLGILRAGVPHVLDDLWEYGVGARSLLAGLGFRTLVIHPPLWSLRDAATTVPILVHGPLLPMLLAPWIGMFGAGALDGAAWLTAAFAVLAAFAIFRLGARFISPPVGAAAALLWTLSPLTIHAVHHDPALVVGAALIAVAADLVLREAPLALAAGLMLGLACLARPEMLWGAPLLVSAAPRRAWPGAAVGFVLCMSGWWWHDTVATGQPFFNLSSYLVLGYSDRWPALTILRDFDLPPRAFPSAVLHGIPAIVVKAFRFLPHAIKRALMVPSGATGWLAAFGLVAAYTRPRQKMLALAGARIAIVPIAVMCLTLYDERYLVPFLPFWALGSARGIETLASFLPWWGRRPRTWIGLLLLLLLPSTLPTLTEEASAARELRSRLFMERAGLRAKFGVPSRPASASDASRATLVSDTPDFVAWTTGRPVVWMSHAEWESFPRTEAAGGAAAAPGIPAPPDSARTWFHEDERSR